MDSWMSPYNILMYLVCMVTPFGEKCRNYILETYRDCYLNLNYDLLSITRFPNWLWTSVINGDSYTLLVDTSRPECRHLSYQTNEPNYFAIDYILKLCLLLGITASLIYVIIKVAVRLAFKR
ncbi:hypothetical protein KR215_003151 [Drosophila sulfurigaster]|nr:hypothetical protein KR215_003151 [Drosophila sulfurigaster]